MEEVFSGAGAEVTTNEVVAEVATRGICKVCAFINIYKSRERLRSRAIDLERRVSLNPKLQKQEKFKKGLLFKDLQ